MFTHGIKFNYVGVARRQIIQVIREYHGYYI